HPPDEPVSYEYHGAVWSFLLAAVITFWGLLGSVATAFTAVLELEFAGSLSMLILVVLALVLAGAVAFFLRYAWISVDGTLRDQVDRAVVAARSGRVQAARALTAVAEPPGQAFAPPLPRWSLL